MKHTNCEHCLGACSALRRDFLRVGALSFMGIGLSDFLSFRNAQALALTSSAIAAPQAKAQSVILVWLEGGISHLDSWDVKGNSGFRPIATNATGVQVSEIFPWRREAHGQAVHHSIHEIGRKESSAGNDSDPHGSSSESGVEVSQLWLDRLQGIGLA